MNGEEIWWAKLLEGKTKLNTSGPFLVGDGSLGAGMILHDNGGAIMFTAYQGSFTCDNALEVELAACREGITLALQRSPPAHHD